MVRVYIPFHHQNNTSKEQSSSDIDAVIDTPEDFNLDQDCNILKVPARSCCILIFSFGTLCGSKTLTHIGPRGMKIRIFGGFTRLKRSSAIFKKL
jgi:hypothetical protein